MERLTPPPGLPEARAKAWIARHKKKARRERCREAIWKAARLGILLLCGVALALGWKASRDAAELLTVPAAASTAPVPFTPATATQEASPLSDQQTLFVPEVPLEPELQEALWDACDQYAVPYELALAVAEQESRFDLDADNGRCVGAMQINRVNFSWLEAEGLDPTTYEGNLRAGVLMLGQQLEKYGDQHKALMAYNCGEGNAAQLWAKGQVTSTYSRAVLERAEKWKTIIEKGEI